MILYIQLMCQPFWRNSLCRSSGRVNLKTKECFIFATFLQKIEQNLWPLSSFPPYCLPAYMHQDKSTGYFFGWTLLPVWSLPWRCRDFSGVDPRSNTSAPQPSCSALKRKYATQPADTDRSYKYFARSLLPKSLAVLPSDPSIRIRFQLFPDERTAVSNGCICPASFVKTRRGWIFSLRS